MEAYSSYVAFLHVVMADCEGNRNPRYVIIFFDQIILRGEI